MIMSEAGFINGDAEVFDIVKASYRNIFSRYSMYTFVIFGFNSKPFTERLPLCYYKTLIQQQGAVMQPSFFIYFSYTIAVC